MLLALVIVGSRDDFHLKDWQTLIAGAFALFGGALAYWGAMAKVEQDGNQQKRDFLRRQLSLYLKLDITVPEIFVTLRANVRPGSHSSTPAIVSASTSSILKSRLRSRRLGTISTSFHVTSFAK